MVIYDGFPVNKGHLLVIPRRHIENLFGLNRQEWNELQNAIADSKVFLDKNYKPDGYNIGVNVGKYAGQTVFHLHVHIIPRYKGDVENPRGGIRNIKKALVEYNG